jgi:three-Cys-motif partner protein
MTGHREGFALPNDCNQEGSMGELVLGDDGMLVEDVGIWAKEKHEYLVRYLDISRSTRAKFIGPQKGGATYIDLFCGTGRAKVRRTGEYIDGSCVAAWRKSVEGKAPFSEVHIADLDEERLQLAEKRLKLLGAPVIAHHGSAIVTAKRIVNRVGAYGLNFAFVDPFNLGAFDFQIVRELAKLKRIDVLVHISKMDLQRNLGLNIRNQHQAFNAFAPGWREAVNLRQSQAGVRRDVFEHWRSLVSKSGLPASDDIDMKLITGTQGQHLYWLLLVAKHDLALKFWKKAAKSDQGTLFD